MSKQPETEETRICCHIFIINGILIGGPGSSPATPKELTRFITEAPCGKS